MASPDSYVLCVDLYLRVRLGASATGLNVFVRQHRQVLTGGVGWGGGRQEVSWTMGRSKLSARFSL